jgi:hypothetical protein
MALIFLNRYFYPDQSATSQMLSDLAFAQRRKEARNQTSMGLVHEQTKFKGYPEI